MPITARTTTVVSKDEENCFTPSWPNLTKQRNASSGVNRKSTGPSDKNRGLVSAGNRNDARAASQQTGIDNITHIPCGVSSQCPHRYQVFRSAKLPINRKSLTFDMRGAQKAQPFGHPLDGRVGRLLAHAAVIPAIRNPEKARSFTSGAAFSQTASRTFAQTLQHLTALERSSWVRIWQT